MYGRTNAGGGISPFAFIFATYPAGSVCTCTDGSRTLKLKDTSGYGVFYPPYIGTWTVTATDPADPTNTDSETAEITFEGQNVSVELNYRLWLFDNGNQFENITGGWTGTDYTVSSSRNSVAATIGEVLDCTVTGTYQMAIAGTDNAVDLTYIDTLHITASLFAGAQGGLFVSPAKDYNQGVSQVVVEDAGEHTLDVSSLSGKYYIGVYAVSATTYSQIYCSQVWGG